MGHTETYYSFHCFYALIFGFFFFVCDGVCVCFLGGGEVARVKGRYEGMGKWVGLGYIV